MTSFASKVKSLQQERLVSVAQLRDLRRDCDEISQVLDAQLEAQRIVQHVAQEVQNQVHLRISQIVTRCLQAVFGDDAYEFKINFEMKRGKTEAQLVFVRDDLEVDPLTASGGGVVDVAAFALRLAALILSKPQRRRILILDEPFRFVSASFRDRVSQLLVTLANELNLQIIMVTHDSSLQIGNVIEL